MLTFIITSGPADGSEEAPPGRDELCLQVGLCLTYNLQRPSALGAPASLLDSLHARPTSLSISLGALAVARRHPPPKPTHRMWSAMELPLLRNAYSVLFAKYESELFTEGQGLLGREAHLAPSHPLAWSWSPAMTPGITWEAPSLPVKPDGTSTLLDCLWPQADRTIVPLTEGPSEGG